MKAGNSAETLNNSEQFFGLARRRQSFAVIRPSDAQLLAGAAAILLFAISVGGFSLASTDFRAFYESGRAWRGLATDAAWRVSRPDLNPPTFSLLMVPLTYLSLGAAFAVWTVASVLSLVASVRLIARRLQLDGRALGWVVIAAVGFMPFLHVWVEGQLVFFLLYPMTRAWLARSDVRAGLWLVPVIAVKPPLAVFALLLPWRTWLVAGAGSLLVTLNVIGLTGWAPWQSWLELSRAVEWLPTPTNLSVWGVAARLEHGAVARVAMADLSPIWCGVVALVGVLGAWITIRTVGDRRWVLALFVAELVSPLGWVYYLPLALGPSLTTWPRGHAARWAVALIAVPMPLLALVVRLAPAVAVPVASVYFTGLVLAWLAWSRDGVSDAL